MYPSNGGTPSTIDLCLSRGDITTSILSLAVNQDTTSDHSSITVMLSLPSSTPTDSVRRNWNKANWETFSEHIHSTGIDLTNLQGKEDTLQAVTNVTTILHLAINVAVPAGTPRKPEAPRWNHSLTLAKRWVKRVDKRARRCPSSQNREDSQNNHRHWTTMVRAAKTAYRIKQLQSMNTKTIWNTIRHHNTHHRSIPPLKGETVFWAKCASLRNALFPAVNNIPQQHLWDNFLTSKLDLY